MRFPLIPLLFLPLFAAVAVAAPPTLEIPAEVRPAGEYVTIRPKTDAVSITYVGLSGVDAFPGDLLKDPRHFVLPIRGLKDGAYRFAAVASSATGEQARVDFVVPIGQSPPPVTDPPTTPVPTPTPTPTPPTTPAPNPPPVDPPTTPAPVPAVYYFLAIRADGPADPAFTRAMALPAWDQLRFIGHQVKDKTVSEAKAIGYVLPAGAPLPAVVTLQVSADGKRSTVVRHAIAMPTTDEAILKLPTLPKGTVR